MHKVQRGILVHSYVMSVIVNRCIKSDRHPAEVRLSRDNHAHRPIYTGHQDVTLCDLDGLQHGPQRSPYHGSARQCAPCGRLCTSQTLPVGASCFKDYDSTLSATKEVAASAPYKLF